jgi:glycosyltransferase involved in cell wall biosynthesis
MSIEVRGIGNERMGVGQSFRRIVSLLFAAGVSIETHSPTGRKSPGNASRLLIVANPDQAPSLFQDSSSQLRVGFWAWELPMAPKYYSLYKNLLDEVWCPSEFVVQSIQKRLPFKCRRLLMPVPLPYSENLHSLEFGSAEKRSARSPFKVLISFDASSDIRRKNPFAAISAYKKAFSARENTQLIIKFKRAASSSRLENRIHQQMQGRSDYSVISSDMDPLAYQQLLRSSSVYLSLHRAEGYGLNLADAMAMRVPVIATGYSGNLEFMDSSSSILVPYSLVPVNFYSGLPINSFWAEPDLDFAAAALRELFEDPNLRRDIGEAGHSKIAREHSLHVAVKRFQQEFMNV